MPKVNNLLWQLHADVMSRLNQLIDECAHVQSTIKSHLGNFQIDDASTELIPGPEEVRDTSYYFRTPQDRALRNLYISAGILQASLSENAERCTKYFDAILHPSSLGISVNSKPNGGVGESGALYWYISYRGHVLGHVFVRALRQLQHAQEKLIQVLENSPGQIPSPTLLRRWSSGGNAEYLSDYSRTVNARVQRLMRAFLGHEETNSSQSGFDSWRSRRYLTHTWSHTQTSLTTALRYKQNEAKEETSVVTVWSSYFYLEQPTLFPLLYHECSHHYIATDGGANQESAPDNRAETIWRNTTRVSAELLTRASPMQEGNISFWSEVVEELIADTLSISLAHGSFLTALVLQIFGLQTETYKFSDFNLEAKEHVPLNKSGELKYRLLEVEYPTASVDYFWEARLLVACATLERLSIGSATDAEMIREVRELLSEYQLSGSHVHSAGLASSEHEAMWQYRGKLNDWVNDVVRDCLRDFTHRLDSDLVRAIAREQPVDENTKKIIVADAKSVWHTKFGDVAPDELFQDFIAGKHYKSQDVCYVLRWQFGKEVVRRLATEEHTACWSEFYAIYSAYDASVGFRIAQEAQAIATSVYYTAAELLKSPVTYPADVSKDESDFLELLRNAAKLDLEEYQTRHSETSLTDYEFAVRLAKVPQSLADRSHISTCAKAVLSEYHSILREGAGTAIVPGSLSLGVLRTSCISKLGFSEAYAKLKAVSDARFEKRTAELKSHEFLTEANLLSSKAHKPEVLPLFGEYNYVAFYPGITPLTRNMVVPTDGLVLLSKPRFVLRLGEAKPAPADAELTKVSQISFRYQWQWVKLAASMRPLQGTQMFLSGGWEDVVLISHHKNLDEHAHFVATHRLKVRGWMDIHSSVALPKIPLSNNATPLGSTTEGEAISGFAESFRDLLKDCEVWERTGRYDVTVVWGDSVKTVLDLWNMLSKIDRSKWKLVESLSTSLQERIPKRSSIPSEERREKSKRRFVSQFVLRHIH